jgi:fructose-1,6-bisphosphatase/inositol monophosphatase family enzyme
VHNWVARLGELALQLTHEAIEVIQTTRASGNTAKTMIPNPHVKGGFAPITPADLPAQQVYTRAFELECPSIQIVAEEKDPEQPRPPADPTQTCWVVDGLDGSANFSDDMPFGYGTQCALLLPDGSVPIAFVGNAITGDVFGYYGDSGVFHSSANGEWSYLHWSPKVPQLSSHLGWRRPPLESYHPLSQALLNSGDIGNIRERVGGIGTTMAELLTDDTGVFALRSHYEQPWDAIPAYALCEAAGMVFMTPEPSGRGYAPWQPVHKSFGWERNFDLIVLHSSRLDEFNFAVTQL